MAENLIKVPVKGILKNSSSFESSGPHKCHSSRATKWDEMNILATHHPPDKDYGHMKIEEPKTPYSYSHGEDSGDEADGPGVSLDSDLVAQKLKTKSSVPLERVESAEESDEEYENETPEEREKRKSFEFKRKAHYNEFMAVKLARQLMENEDEEDEDDDGEAKDRDDNENEEEDENEDEDQDNGKLQINEPDITMDTKDVADNTLAME